MANPGFVQRGCVVVGHGDDADTLEALTLEQILQALPPIAPRLAHHTVAGELEHIERVVDTAIRVRKVSVAFAPLLDRANKRIGALDCCDDQLSRLPLKQLLTTPLS